ncbi:RsmB/NOP family class I SAM-dependent RNA methyltransferase [Halovulum sp. GXIMD14793]
MPPKTKSAPGLAPRKAAAALLHTVLEDQKMLSDAQLSDDLEPSGRARAQTLAAGVLRHLHPIDVLLAQFISREPPLAVLNVLRIAAYELLVDGVPAHAVVDAAVRQMRGNKRTVRMAGLVNAVGRRLATEGPEIWRDLGSAPLPDWIGGPLGAMVSAETVAAIEQVHASTPPTDLTPRIAAEAEDLAEKLEAQILPTGSLRLTRSGQITRLPGYDTGAWWVQDAAASLPVRMLGQISGQVLDLCAAPGSKTLQLAATGADVTAVDISAARMARVKENLARTGLKAQMVTADLRRWQPEGPADVIVLDAPCSASGTLRRHPDLPHVRPDPDLKPLLELQAQLLDRALGWLKPGGRLLYITCSLLPAEGEDQIAAALQRHKGLRIQPAALAGLPDGALTTEGMLRTRPDMWADMGGMDGFFAAVLTR